MTRAVDHPVFARLFTALVPGIERAGMARLRTQLLADAAGTVLEVGAGTGVGFGHLPPAVDRVVAVEPEPRLRRRARAAAAEAAVEVEVLDAVAERLPIDDATIDVAVSVHVLCSVHDPDLALGELMRVVRPGGTLRFIEHVRAGPVASVAQRALDVVWPRVAGGCHTHRDTLAAIVDAGFEIRRLERFRFPGGLIPLPMSPHVMGIASRPDGRNAQR